MTTVRNRVRRSGSDDRGSMLLALSGVLVVTGIMMAFLVTVLIAQNSTRYDYRYTKSIQGADAGVQQAYYQINTLPAGSTSTYLTSGGTVTLDGVDYSWTATRPAPESLTWTVESTGASVVGTQTTTRKVTATVAQSALFNMAAFADSTLNFNGNNLATSYPAAGQGQIGTNGSMTLLGNSTSVDAVVLYDYDANPDPTRCTGAACSAPTTQNGSKLDITAAAGTDGFIQAQLDVCKAVAPLTAFVGTTIAARPEPYCFTSFFADTQNFTVTGPGTARIFVEGGDVVLGNKNHSDVNNDVPGSPTSIKLQIYTTGNTVSVYNQGEIAAAVYGPNAACGGVNSNAGTTFYGSMICKTIDNVGGWTFKYDTRLSSIGDGVWRVKDYSEPGT